MPAEEKESTLKQEEVLVAWEAASRPFKRRSSDFYVRIVSVAALFGVVLFLIEGFMPVLLIIALVFLFYVLSTVEPDNIKYEITNLGVKVAGRRTDWEAMGRFWYTSRFGSELLVIETGSLAGRMEIIAKPELKDKITKEVSKYLVHEEVPPTVMDKASEWASKRFPSQ